MQAFSAVVTAAVFAVATPAFADAQRQVQAARKAERRGEWHKALDAWKAAYASDGNAEYLIGIGDASAHLGNDDEAKKNYEAYLADPLALPANLEKVKAKIVALKSALALPGAGLPLPGKEARRVADDARTKKKDAAPLALPGLDLPPAQPAPIAARDSALPLLGVEAPSTPRRDDGKKTASTSPAPLELPLPAVATKSLPAATPKKDADPAVASRPLTTGKPIAMTTPPAAPKAPVGALTDTPAPRGHGEVTSGTQRTVAYVAAAVAVVALGGGAYAFTQASSAHGDLTGKVHDGATAQQLLETERRNKTLSFVGLSGGLVVAGIATALFAF
jgi:hypothetical protein